MSNKIDLKFTQKDKEQLIGFMNFNAKYAKLQNLTYEETIEFVALLRHLQQILLPKLTYCIDELTRLDSKVATDSSFKPATPLVEKKRKRTKKE